MGKEVFAHGEMDFGSHKFNIGLSLVQFKEDEVIILYSPALDLSGYGNTEKEAYDSFSIALNEFIRYTKNKKTLNTILKDLGWIIKGSNKKPKFKSPKDSDLVNTNPTYNDIINSKDFSLSRQTIEVAY